jgi:hypothetical protein
MNGQVNLIVQSDKKEYFPLKLRIPEWNKRSILRVNDENIPVKSGTYATINRDWNPGDKVFLELDLRGRIINAPSGAPDRAIMRGPILLALDNRLVNAKDINVWLIPEKARRDENGSILPEWNLAVKGDDAYVELKPVTNKSDEIWMAFEVSVLVRPTHFVGHYLEQLTLCDYASAGNKWNADNTFRVWLPQPLFLKNAFIKDTWRLMHRDGKRPEIPGDNLIN